MPELDRVDDGTDKEQAEQINLRIPSVILNKIRRVIKDRCITSQVPPHGGEMDNPLEVKFTIV